MIGEKNRQIALSRYQQQQTGNGWNQDFSWKQSGLFLFEKIDKDFEWDMGRKIRLQFLLYCRLYWLKMPLIDLEPLALLKSRSTTTFPPWTGMPYWGWRLTSFLSWKMTRTPPTLTWGRSGTTTRTWWRPTTPGPRPRTPMTLKCPFHHLLPLRQDTGVFHEVFFKCRIETDIFENCFDI